MAKELSMAEKTQKGRQARLYFIECERRLKAFRQTGFGLMHPMIDEAIRQTICETIDTIQPIIIQTIRETVSGSIDQLRPAIRQAVIDAFDPFDLLSPMVAKAVRTAGGEAFDKIVRLADSDAFDTHIILNRVGNDAGGIKKDARKVTDTASHPKNDDHGNQTNPESSFVKERCELVPNARTPKEALHTAYTAHCREKGFHAVSRNYFFRRLYEISGELSSSSVTRDGTRTPAVKGIALGAM